MKDDNFLLPQHFHIKYLTVIEGIKFTRREVDVMACIFSARRTSKIVSLLDILESTVRTHVKNIMLKLACNSREYIIDFIEKSHQAHLIKIYYKYLVIESEFKKTLQTISKLKFQEKPSPLIIFWKNPHQKNILINQLAKDLELLKIKVKIREYNHDLRPDQNKTSAHTILYFKEKLNQEMESKWLEKFECINLSNQENYYLCLFTILKKLIFHVDLDKPISSFIKVCEEYKIFPTDSEISSESQEIQQGKTSPLKNSKLPIFSAIGALICVAVCVVFIFFRPNKTNLINSPDKIISSDFVVPSAKAFLNRPDLLKKIDDSFLNQLDIKSLAVTGIGGSGKTTLVRQYAQSQRSSIKWEINVETKESLKNSFANLAYALVKTDQQKQYLKELEYIKDPIEKEKRILQLVKEGLRSHSDWLLIYDNVLQLNKIQNYFPSDPNTWGKGKIILTTRDANIQNSGHVNAVIQIGELDPHQKLDLFVKIISDKNSRDNESSNINKIEEYQSFLKEIPPFPLDISVAAYYLKTTGASYLHYLKYLREHDKDFEKVNQGVLRDHSSYDRTRNSIITLSLNHLIKANKDFTGLLLFICLLDSQHISKELLDQLNGSTFADNFIYHLKKFSLIENKDIESKNKTVFVIHRNIQELISSYLKENNYFKNNETIKKISLILNEYIKDAYRKQNFQKEVPILINYCTKFLSHEKEFSWDVIVPIKIALESIYTRSGQFDKSEEILKNTLTNLHEYDNKDYLKIAQVLEKLGRLYRILEEFDQSRYYYEKMLEVSKQYVLKDPLYHAEILAWVGDSYGMTYNYQKAIELLERSIKLYKSQTSNDGIKNIYIPLNHLANIYRKLGKYKKAEELLLQSITISKQHFPENSYIVNGDMVNLGELYLESGDYQKSKYYLESVLERGRKNWPKYDLIIGYILEIICKLYTELGDYEKAKKYLEEHLAFTKKVFPERSIRTVPILISLGNLHQELKNYHEARNYLEKSLRIYEKLRKHRPEILAEILLSLGRLHRTLKNYKEAQHFYHESIRIYTELLGGNNIKTSWVLSNLGILYKDLGNYRQAKDLLNKSLIIHESTYTKNHINTARILMNLGHTYLLEGDKEKAKNYLQKALSIFQEQNHPDLHECKSYLQLLNAK